MGFKHVVSSVIQSATITSGSIASSTNYPATTIGQGKDTENLLSTDSSGAFSLYVSFGFGTFSIPTDATITKVWCDISINAFTRYEDSVTRSCQLYKGEYSFSNGVSPTATSSSQIKIITANGIGTMPTISVVNSGGITMQFYSNGGGIKYGLVGGATLYVEYEDETPDTHGIFNLILPRG